MISKTGIHAISAFAALAKLSKGQFAGAADIAHEIGAPPNYLGKLLKDFVAEGLVESQKGRGGGFRLAKKPEHISFFDIVEPIEQISKRTGCFFGRAKCSDLHPCSVHRQWAEVRDRYLKFLKETTIADLGRTTFGIPLRS